MHFAGGAATLSGWWSWWTADSDAVGEKEDVVDEDRWAIAYTTGFDDEAVLIKGFLAQSDIDCIIEDAKFHAQPVNIGDMAEIRLLVRADQLDEARRLIAEARASRDSEPEDTD